MLLSFEAIWTRRDPKCLTVLVGGKFIRLVSNTDNYSYASSAVELEILIKFDDYFERSACGSIDESAA